MTHAHAAEWERMAPLPEPNAGFICGAMNGEIVVAGGTNWEGGAKRWLDAVHVYSPRENTWRSAPRLAAPTAYAVFGSTPYHRILFAGGSSGERTHASLFNFDAEFRSSVLRKAEPGLVYAAGGVIGVELIVVGGAPVQDDLAQLTNAATAHHPYAPSGPFGPTARSLAPVPGPGFGIAASAVCGGKLYIFGGATWDAAASTVRNLATAYVYDPKANAWQTLPNLPRANRGLAAVALDERRILIAGGYADEAFSDEAFVFDTAAPAYRPSVKLPYRALVALVVCGDYVYCLGGEDEKKHRTAACYRIPVGALLP